MPAIDLNGANVAVTGAAREIGLATAAAFAAGGARVWLGDLDGLDTVARAANSDRVAEMVGGEAGDGA